MRKSLVILGILNDNDIEWILANSQKHHLQPGEYIIRQKEPSSSIFFLMDGALEVALDKPVQRILAMLYPGEIVGEISLLDSRPPSASVRAIENSLLLGLSHQTLHQKLAVDVAFQGRLFRALAVFLASRLRRTDELFAALSGGTTTDEDQEDPDELDPEVLNNIAMAAKRFEFMVNCTMG